MQFADRAQRRRSRLAPSGNANVVSRQRRDGGPGAHRDRPGAVLNVPGPPADAIHDDDMIQRLRQILLFAVGFSLPLAGFSLFNIGPFGMTPFKLITAGLFVLAAIELTLAGRRRVRDRATVWVLFFAVAVAVSVFQGFVRGVPPGKLTAEATTYVSIVLFYFLVSFVIAETPSLKILLWGLVIGGATTALPAVLGFQQAGTGGRFTGLSGQENLLGADMAAVIPIAAALLFTARSRVVRLVLVGLLLVATAGLLASLSRTAFVAGIGMWGLWVVRSGRIDTIRYVIPAAMFGAALVLLAPEAAVDRVESFTNPQRRMADGSIQSRVHQIEFSFKAIASSPLIGVGMLNFPLWAQGQPGGRVIGHVVHNSYLGVLVAQGLLGFIPYVMILLMAWIQYGEAWRGARRGRKLRDPRLAELGTYALLLQIALFGGMVEGLAGIMQKSKTMWLIIALSPVVRHLVAQRFEELQASGEAGAPTRPDEAVAARAPAGAAWT